MCVCEKVPGSNVLHMYNQVHISVCYLHTMYVSFGMCIACNMLVSNNFYILSACFPHFWYFPAASGFVWFSFGGMCVVLIIQRDIQTHVLMETRDVHADILK